MNRLNFICVVGKPFFKCHVALQKHAHAIYSFFLSCKKLNFSVDFFFFDIFLTFAQNIDCGYTLEPPRGGSNEYPQSMF